MESLKGLSATWQRELWELDHLESSSRCSDGCFAINWIITSGFSGKLGTILIGIIQIPITLFGAILMDRSGRRVLLMVFASGTFLGCFLIGVSFYLKAQGLFVEWVPALPVSGILVYIGAFSIGMGLVPWVVMSEIYNGEANILLLNNQAQRSPSCGLSYESLEEPVFLKGFAIGT